MSISRNYILAFTILALTLLMAAVLFAENRSAIVQFRAFSLSPGQKVSGITVKTSDGFVQTAGVPGRWRCEREAKSVHCFCLHPQYAVAMTGKLPEIIVLDLTGSPQDLRVEASIEYLDSNGKEFTREFGTSDMIIK